MTILSDKAILSALDAGELEIEPFNGDHLTPNGYDLTIKEIEIQLIETQTTINLMLRVNSDIEKPPLKYDRELFESRKYALC